MPKHARILEAAFVGGYSVVCAASPSVFMSPPAQGVADARPADRLDDISAWTALDGEGLSLAASDIRSYAQAAWIANDMEEKKAVRLAEDVEAILRAIWAPDFEKYHAFVISRGLTLDTMATALTDQLIEWEFYPATTPELAPDRPVEQRIAYIWNHPNERRVEWGSVRLSSLAVGFGLVIDSRIHDWPYPGNYAQMSVYIPPHGRLTVTDGEAVNASKDSAWISIEGRFKNGMQTRARINFYYDKSLANWVPLNIVFGTDGDHRPFPLL